jgi:uncharacterized protein YhjY with autotransporter beta-barrel domain
VSGGTSCSETTSAGAGYDVLSYGCTTSLSGSTASSATVYNQGGAFVTTLTATASGTVDVSEGRSATSYAGVGAYNDWPNTQPVGPWTSGPDLALTADNVDVTLTNGLASPTSGAVLLQSYGADGTNSGEHNNNTVLPQYVGGTGGTVSVDLSGSVTLSGFGGFAAPGESLYPASPIASALGGLFAISQGGAGGSYNTENGCCVGNGGAGGDVSVQIGADSSFKLQNIAGEVLTAGIVAMSVGGAPGQYQSDLASFYGQGGKAGEVGVSLGSGTSITSDVQQDSIGVLAASIGGSGTATDGATAIAGSASTVGVALTNSTITMSGQNSVGLLAVSSAGTFGNVSDNDPTGGEVYVIVDKDSRISAEGGGQFSSGIMAVSSGTASILSLLDLNGSNSDTISTSGAGNSGDVTVANAASISTSGMMAVGIAALSTGGAGIVSKASGSGLSYLGASGTDHSTSTGDVALYNSGSVTTQGDNAFGLAAISTGGGGLIVSEVDAAKSGDSWTDGAIVGNATDGDEPNGHPAGEVTVVNDGAITTGDGNGGGTVAIGIVAQSIGGGGGSASGTALFVGDNGGSGGNGDTVAVRTNGRITTQDKGAVAILAQSIGGGGGSGANAKGLFVAVGGQGGNGGNGGAVTVDIGPQSVPSRTIDPGVAGLGSYTLPGGTLGGSTPQAIQTRGDYASGVIAQSIGGGGGHGGYADSLGLFIDASIGGTGGTAGSGGAVTVTNHGANLTTVGNQSHGIIVQSIAGGGGTGGTARGNGEGLGADATISLGGNAGSGAGAGKVTVDNQGTILTGCLDPSSCAAGTTSSYKNLGGPRIDGADSIGILAQSIGGGGGHGGGASAKSQALPVDGIPTFSASYSMGGKGGTGGDGGSIDVSNGGAVLTQGDGAHGVLAQSIGGGGGNGGDSTTNAVADGSDMSSFTASVSLGGSGAAGGDVANETVTITNGGSGGPARIATFGQDAVGILAQSIGGGGGSGALGNSDGSFSEEDDDDDDGGGDDSGGGSDGDLAAASDDDGGGDDDEGASKSIGVSFSIGGSGGAAGSAGTVTITNAAGSQIRTLGSGSSGIVAQSIGGGGGHGGGGTASADGADYTMSVSLGGSGGAAGNGGSVTVTNAGSISTGSTYKTGQGRMATTGGDGIGILAQAVGGGGGKGGLSDPSASFDQGEDDSDDSDGSDELASANAAQAEDDPDDEPAASYSASIGLGGKGGAAGSGGVGNDTVKVSSSGSITTVGVRAYGILAQSVGGGGGIGGTASSSSGEIDDDSYSAQLGLGGSGGANGDGWLVDVGNTGSIATAGYAAHGIVAQSIGGGGGIAADGTGNNASTIIFGNQNDAGDDSGSGYQVTIAEIGNITTAGDDAYGILAQVIGGGGGFASAGCSNSDAPAGAKIAATACFGNDSTSTAPDAWSDSSKVVAIFEAQNTTDVNASISSGAAISIGPGVGNIVTTGARAIGLVAQSIGGGGGLVAAANGNVAGAVLATSSGGNGGAIDITLGESDGDPGDATIATAGAGAYGMLLQSIGGGGGFAGDSSLPLASLLPVVSTLDGTAIANGGAIDVTLNGDIRTTGPRAHGIFAQSLGGGGLTAGYGGQLSVTIGEKQPGYGGPVSITQNAGTISTSGTGAIAIFAQIEGNQTAATSIATIDIGGRVIGGTGTGSAGIIISGGARDGASSTVTVEQGGSVGTADGVDGMAIQSVGGLTNVNNYGTLTGNFDLAGGTVDNEAASALVTKTHNPAGSAGVFRNYGTLAAGPRLAARAVVNRGAMSIGGDGDIATTRLDGTFGQGRAGRLRIDADHLEKQADRLIVTGNARLRGTVKVNPLTLTDDPVTILRAGRALSVDPGTRFVGTHVVRYTARFLDRHRLELVPHADFHADDAGLTENQREVAAALQDIWDSEDADAFARGLAAAGAAGDADALASSLESMTAQSVSAISAARLQASRSFVSNMESCPSFVGGTTLLTETECGWGRVIGSYLKRDGDDETVGFSNKTITIQFGGQKAVAPEWFVNGSIAYETSSLDANHDAASVNGQGVLAGVGLKRQTGPLLLSAALDLGYGWYDSDRTIELETGSQHAKGSPDAANVGLHGRIAYEVPFERWYLRPLIDLDATYVRMDSYNEDGAGDFDLEVDSADKLVLAGTPALEIGARLPLSGGTVLRPYASAGVSFFSGNNWEVDAGFRNAPDDAGQFSSELANANVMARFSAGVDVITAGSVDVKLQYDAQIADDMWANAGTLRVNYRF